MNLSELYQGLEAYFKKIYLSDEVINYSKYIAVALALIPMGLTTIP
jgi:hypothetical protein